jgi:hypothetical protein
MVLPVQTSSSTRAALAGRRNGRTGFLTRFNDTELYVVFSLECCPKITISINGCSLLFLTSKYWGGGPPESLENLSKLNEM